MAQDGGAATGLRSCMTSKCPAGDRERQKICASRGTEKGSGSHRKQRRKFPSISNKGILTKLFSNLCFFFHPLPQNLFSPSRWLRHPYRDFWLSELWLPFKFSLQRPARSWAGECTCRQVDPMNFPKYVFHFTTTRPQHPRQLRQQWYQRRCNASIGESLFRYSPVFITIFTFIYT